MARVTKPLRVLPNPYRMLDHNAQPCAAVMCQQGSHVPMGTIRYVGAKIVDAVEVRPAVETKIGNVTHQTLAADHELVWDFESNPIEVPDIGYYRSCVNNGELIAADKPTAQRCGISEFTDPKKLLAAEKAAARKAWDDQHGAGDFDAAEQERSPASAQPAPTPETTKGSK